MRRARWKRKNVRRGMVGGPLRQSGTKTRCPWGNLRHGEVWDTSCADFRCRWPVVDGSLSSGPMRASAPTTARGARSEAERAEREAGQMRPCTPMPPHHPPRDGSIDLAEDDRVPEGKPNSALAPIRRPPSRAEGRCTGARLKRFFLFHRARRILFLSRTKREWGAHPRRTSPPAGAESPVAAVRRPAFPRGVPQKERALPFIFPQTRTRTPSR